MRLGFVKKTQDPKKTPPKKTPQHHQENLNKNLKRGAPQLAMSTRSSLTHQQNNCSKVRASSSGGPPAKPTCRRTEDAHMEFNVIRELDVLKPASKPGSIPQPQQLLNTIFAKRNPPPHPPGFNCTPPAYHTRPCMQRPNTQANADSLSQKLLPVPPTGFQLYAASIWMRMTVSPSGCGCCWGCTTFTQNASGPSTSMAMRLRGRGRRGEGRGRLAVGGWSYRWCVHVYMCGWWLKVGGDGRERLVVGRTGGVFARVYMCGWWLRVGREGRSSWWWSYR